MQYLKTKIELCVTPGNAKTFDEPASIPQRHSSWISKQHKEMLTLKTLLELGEQPLRPPPPKPQPIFHHKAAASIHDKRPTLLFNPAHDSKTESLILNHSF